MATTYLRKYNASKIIINLNIGKIYEQTGFITSNEEYRFMDWEVVIYNTLRSFINEYILVI